MSIPTGYYFWSKIKKKNNMGSLGKKSILFLDEESSVFSSFNRGLNALLNVLNSLQEAKVKQTHNTFKQ